MAINRQKITVKTKRYSADGLSMKSISDENTRETIRFATYGLIAGVAYSLITGKSVFFGIIMGGLLGSIVGSYADKAKLKKVEKDFLDKIEKLKSNEQSREQ
jgi:hypothetical protein